MIVGIKSTTLFIVPLLICINSYTQSLVNTTGNVLLNTSYNIEYSVGEIAITTISGSNNHVTQGLIQPNIKSIAPVCDVFNQLFVGFANPTRDKVRVVGQYDWITHFAVYATDGKLVKKGVFANNVIDLTGLPAAIYFIRLYPGCDKNFKVLKVLKQL